MEDYKIKKEELLSHYQSDFENGLTAEEVSKSLEENGANLLDEPKKKTLFMKFLGEFNDMLIIILLISALISAIVAYNEGGGSHYFEPFLIVLIVVINAIMGLVQENKAEKSLEALKKLSQDKAKVVRNGQIEIIDAKDIVVGDIMMLESGDNILADGRIISSSSLQSVEARLTGESVASSKNEQDITEEKALAKRKNMVYSGCFVSYGSGKVLVTKVGMQTEMGKIADLLNNEKDSKTPLQIKLQALGKKIGIMALLICIAVFFIGYFNGINVIEIFTISVSLAVSAIPEGLPVIVTIVLALGVERMSKKNAITKKLPAVETLGSTSIICSDKTGTLTENKMTVVKALTVNNTLEEISENNQNNVKEMLNYFTLCSNASIRNENGEELHFGDPTESALVKASLVNGFSKNDLEKKYERVAELPFDSNRKLMSVILKIDQGYLIVTKGSFESIKNIAKNTEGFQQSVDQFGENALRVLALATKKIDEIPAVIDPTTIENNLEFQGIVGMIDRARKEVKQSVKLCLESGIKPIMITGDSKVTAKAIASELNIFQDGDIVMSGAELDKLSDEEFIKVIRNISVYARVSPENKIRVVKAYKDLGEVVAMTGDGVNDAPALKAADIGCAMGITGTDVSKGAADLILMDDNFATIVEAVKEGRGIYNNIKRTVGFLLGTNLGEVIIVFFSILLFKVSPLISVQLLYINLVTDSLPAIALGVEKIDDDVMFDKPRPKNESIFANGYGIQVILQGIMFGILGIIAFVIGSKESHIAGSTMTFITLSMSQIFHAYNMRSHKSIFKIGVFSNKQLNIGSLIAILLTAIICLTPFIQTIFNVEYLSLNNYLIAIGLAMTPILVLEIFKALKMVKK